MSEEKDQEEQEATGGFYSYKELEFEDTSGERHTVLAVVKEKNKDQK